MEPDPWDEPGAREGYEAWQRLEALKEYTRQMQLMYNDFYIQETKGWPAN